jgi:hypothetical protein
MNSIDSGRVSTIAGALFDLVVVPLAAARKDSGAPSYFAAAGEASAQSYFGPPSLAVMKPADFEFAGDGSPAGLVNALNSYWTENGDTDLCVLAPHLSTIAELLREEDMAGDGSVDILCYTMF